MVRISLNNEPTCWSIIGRIFNTGKRYIYRARVNIWSWNNILNRDCARRSLNYTILWINTDCSLYNTSSLTNLQFDLRGILNADTALYSERINWSKTKLVCSNFTIDYWCLIDSINYKLSRLSICYSNRILNVRIFTNNKSTII